MVLSNEELILKTMAKITVKFRQLMEQIELETEIMEAQAEILRELKESTP